MSVRHQSLKCCFISCKNGNVFYNTEGVSPCSVILSSKLAPLWALIVFFLGGGGTLVRKKCILQRLIPGLIEVCRHRFAQRCFADITGRVKAAPVTDVTQVGQLLVLLEHQKHVAVKSRLESFCFGPRLSNY